jgi:ABC-type nitrate/sulfonate/bicarbonate transport system ATPase subunit
MNIELKNITKKYDNYVFKDFSTSFRSGKTTAVMGMSGMGKTTLFNIICSLVKVEKGDVIFSENPKISAVFQENRLLPNFTALENITAMGIKKEKALEALKMCSGIDFANVKVKNLSGGMARRCAIARAIAFDGNLYIFDEPFKGIDISTYDRILLLIKQHLKGKTCILITHSIKDALFLADDIKIIGGQPADVVFEAEDIEKCENLEEKIKNVFSLM